MLTKVETSVPLSHSLLAEFAPYTRNENTAQLVEKALVYYLAALKRQARGERDIEIINAHAQRFKCEAEENLGFQDIS